MTAIGKSSFAPVVDSHTRVLVLGSLPGEISLSRGEYYANRRNQFWRLMQSVIGMEWEDAGYLERLADLRAAGVGLWDVVRTAERVGSLDGNIRNHQANALGEFAATLPELRAIAFNGGKAAAIGLKQLGDACGCATIPLPSSSPANTMSFDRKLEAWLQLKPFLAT